VLNTVVVRTRSLASARRIWRDALGRSAPIRVTERATDRLADRITNRRLTTHTTSGRSPVDRVRQTWSMFTSSRLLIGLGSESSPPTRTTSSRLPTRSDPESLCFALESTGTRPEIGTRSSLRRGSMPESSLPAGALGVPV
jgi:hypothetical protein